MDTSNMESSIALRGSMESHKLLRYNMESAKHLKKEVGRKAARKVGSAYKWKSTWNHQKLDTLLSLKDFAFFLNK